MKEVERGGLMIFWRASGCDLEKILACSQPCAKYKAAGLDFLHSKLELWGDTDIEPKFKEKLFLVRLVYKEMTFSPATDLPMSKIGPLSPLLTVQLPQHIEICLCLILWHVMKKRKIIE